MMSIVVTLTAFLVWKIDSPTIGVIPYATQGALDLVHPPPVKRTTDFYLCYHGNIIGRGTRIQPKFKGSESFTQLLLWVLNCHRLSVE